MNLYVQQQENVLIIGDFNSRMGNLSDFNRPTAHISYTNNPDTTINNNGRDLMSLCLSHNILPINHLTCNDIICDGNLTFKRRDQWISQLDWALCSANLVKHIDSFTIDNHTNIQTDHAPVTLRLSNLGYSPSHLLSCAKQLGAYETPILGSISKKPIRSKSVNPMKLLRNLNLPSQQTLRNPDINGICQDLADTIYHAAKQSTEKLTKPTYTPPQNAAQRWNHILTHENDRQLWQAINWKGQLNEISTPNQTDKPSDTCFSEHFQGLLNSNSPDATNFSPQQQRYIPVLDDPIQGVEVDRCIRKLKSNKAAGTDGISPGILKLLPINWIILLTQLFNHVFLTLYPPTWTMMKVFTIYKKGTKDDPNNYRGISILSAIPKLYDMILSHRFSLWYTPRPEQAGAQPGRGCEEQILTVRLIIDIARKTKKLLYVAFIDYHKAYDKVNRVKLLQYLDQRGCGNQFLQALQQSMTSTGVIGNTTFTTSQGVKQGGSSSCNSFTAYIDPTIDAVNTFGPDNWLENLHILLLMDDTVVFASSREALYQKLQFLKKSADSIGMTLHPTKCQYMTVNTNDDAPITIQDITIEKTDQYIYLGAALSNNPIATQVKKHINNKSAHIRKFYSFLAKNNDSPYVVKLKVWNSALNTAVLYSCETWLTNDLRNVEASYNNTLKQMLSVRQTTCNDIVFAETGQPDAKSVIIDRQRKFLHNLRARPPSYVTDVINLAVRTKCPMGRRIEALLKINTCQQLKFRTELKTRLQTSDSTRRMLYRQINPAINTYEALKLLTIPEHHRVALSRIRTGSHHLRSETGRWARIPPENRICQCRTGIQDEEHVLLRCPLSENLRQSHNIHYDHMPELFEHNTKQLAEYCYLILKLYRT